MKNNEIITRLRCAMKQSGINQAKLAKAVGITPQAVGRWFKNNVIGKDSLILAAKATGVSVGWLLTGEEDSLRDKMRRSQYELDDILQQQKEVTDSFNNARIYDQDTFGTKVPLISWVQAGTWTEMANDMEIEEYYPCPDKHSSDTFALSVRGESMHPDFVEGEIIYVDPDVEAASGSFVVVQQNGDLDATFKQLMFDGDRRYLKALNPGWPNPIVEMLPDATICGVIIGSYKKRN